MKRPSVGELITKPQLLDKLTVPQLQDFLAKLKSTPAANAGKRWATPGDMAFELSKHLPHARRWKRAKHLDYISQKLADLANGTSETPYLMISTPPRHGKLLSHKTLAPTPSGMVKHGSLKVGDLVYGQDGKAYPVLALSEDAPATLRLTFSDKTQVVCHENHEWVVRTGRGQETLDARQLQVGWSVPPVPSRGMAAREVVSIESVAPEPGRCIQVGSPDGVYLVTLSFIPTHNSELCSFWFPLWLLSRHPDELVILCSYGVQYAAEWGRKVRDFVKGYGEKMGATLRKDITAGDNWRVTQGGGLYTTGVDGRITGMGTKAMIIDDPIKGADEAASETIREKTWNWWQSDVLSRIENGFALVIATRWHEDDLLGRLQAHSESGEGLPWEIINFPALAEEEDVLGRNVGDVLWPEVRDRKYLQWKRKGSTPYTWGALYQGRPSPEEGGAIKYEWWKFYEVPPATERFDEVIQSWDMTFKDLKKSDYVVGQVWGRIGALFYLLDQIRDRMDMPETCAALQSLSARWPQATLKLVEDAANGPAVAAALRDTVPGIVLWPPKGQKRNSKEERLAAVAPFIQAGNVQIPDRSIAPWVDDFMHELAAFPNGANDDQCFPAGTMVATLTGPRSIESIGAGDLVLAPGGLTRVLDAGSTGQAPVIQNGRLTGTPGHKVWDGEKFQRLDTIPYDLYDTINLWSQIRWSVRRSLSSSGSFIVSWAGRDDIISASRTRTKGGRGRGGCTSRSGSIFLARRCREAIVCITRMATHSITALAILSAYRIASILGSAMRKVSGLRGSLLTLSGFARLRQLGIAAKRVVLGTARTLAAQGQSASCDALSAATSTLPIAGSTVLADAICGCGPESDECSSSEHVLLVGRGSRLGRTGEEQPRRAADRAECAIATVYNLTTEAGVYYANGVLVSNCDSLSQALGYFRPKAGAAIRGDWKEALRVGEGLPRNPEELMAARFAVSHRKAMKKAEKDYNRSQRPRSRASRVRAW